MRSLLSLFFLICQGHVQMTFYDKRAYQSGDALFQWPYVCPWFIRNERKLKEVFLHHLNIKILKLKPFHHGIKLQIMTSTSFQLIDRLLINLRFSYKAGLHIFNRVEWRRQCGLPLDMDMFITTSKTGDTNRRPTASPKNRHWLLEVEIRMEGQRPILKIYFSS